MNALVASLTAMDTAQRIQSANEMKGQLLGLQSRQSGVLA
jgi:hypothetical protein